MMIESMILGSLAGVTLGIFFFGGLWLTVQKGMTAETPALWFFVSFMVRMAAALMGFYVIASQAKWYVLGVALLGFVLVRVILTRITQEPLTGQHHAS